MHLVKHTYVENQNSGEPLHLLLADHQIAVALVGCTSHHPGAIENNIINSKKDRELNGNRYKDTCTCLHA